MYVSCESPLGHKSAFSPIWHPLEHGTGGKSPRRSLPVTSVGVTAGTVRDHAKPLRSWPLLVLAVPAAAEYGPAGSASRRRPASAWCPCCLASGPRFVWTQPSPCRPASSATRPTRCAPGSPPTTRSATGPGSSRGGQRSSPSRSAWPGRSRFTSWTKTGPPGRPGPSPPSCPASRSWSWAWGPPSPTCSARTPQQPTAHKPTLPDQRPGPTRSPDQQSGDQPDQNPPDRTAIEHRPPDRSVALPLRDGHGMAEHPATAPRAAGPDIDRARGIARELARAGQHVSRRALRSRGVKRSNEALNALALRLSAELAICTAGCS